MIKGIITGQRLELNNVPLIVSDSVDYLKAIFLFRSKVWEDCEKWAHFSQGDTVYDIKLTNNEILREDHLNLGHGRWEVYLHGTNKNGMRITTSSVRFNVKKSGALNGVPMPEIPLSVAESFDNRISMLEKSTPGGGGGGTTFFPHVSEDGVISWTNDGGFPNPSPASIKGPQGEKGDAGATGAAGYTPVKGTDYFTEADKAEMVQAVITQLPVYDGEVVAE